MTQRSILAGKTPDIVIKAGASVSVKGQEGDWIVSEANGPWGLKVERRRDVIEVQLGGSGKVFVPTGSNLKVYAGKDIDVHTIHGQVVAYSGLNLNLQDVYCLGSASAGGSMIVDCRTIRGEKVEFAAGGDLRFHMRDLTSAHIRVRDLDGYWEARIGGGEKLIYLKCGGYVTLVTDQKIDPLQPDYFLGKIEKPSVA
jgi:hypothetical protein